MRIDVYVPLLLSTPFGVAAPWAVRGLPPRAATWLLTCTAVVAAGTWATALALLAFTLVGQIPLVASEGPWSAGVLAANDPVHRSVALVCGLVLLASVAGLTVVSWRRVRVLVDGWRECRELPAAGDLAVVDDPVPTAFALPGCRAGSWSPPACCRHCPPMNDAPCSRTNERICAIATICSCSCSKWRRPSIRCCARSSGRGLHGGTVGGRRSSRRGRGPHSGGPCRRPRGPGHEKGTATRLPATGGPVRGACKPC